MKLDALRGPAALVAGLAFFISAAPAAAKGGPNKVKVQPTVRTVKTGGNSASLGRAPKANTRPAAAKAGRPANPGTAATARAPKVKTQTAARGNSPAARTTAGTAVTKKSAPSSRTATTPIPPTAPLPTTPQNKAQRLLAQNTNLRTKLQSRLPAGTDINAAAAGFRNLGQFVAAVNVSNNQGVDFFALRALMTGEQPLSLGQALQQLRGVDPDTATLVADRALSQASAEIDTSTRKAKVKGSAGRR